MIENWIDQVCAAFEIADHKGGVVRSYRTFEKAEFPESISTFPSALTYVKQMTPGFDEESGTEVLWEGVTEFHLFPDNKKANYPEAMRYIGRIWAAALLNITLGGLVQHFQLDHTGPAIVGPVTLQYGSETPHMGLVVNWRVTEIVTYSLADGVSFYGEGALYG